MAEDVTGKKYPFTNEDGSLTEEYRDGVDALNQHDKKEWERMGEMAKNAFGKKCHKPVLTEFGDIRSESLGSPEGDSKEDK